MVIRFEGPACLLRDLNRRLNGGFGRTETRVDPIELKRFLQVFEEVTRKKCQLFIFFKPCPGCLALNDKYLQLGGFGIDVYTAKFNDVTKISDFIRTNALKNIPVGRP